MTAAAKGIEDGVIKTLGRWASRAYPQHVQSVGYSHCLTE